LGDAQGEVSKTDILKGKCEAGLKGFKPKALP